MNTKQRKLVAAWAFFGLGLALGDLADRTAEWATGAQRPDDATRCGAKSAATQGETS